MKTTPVARLRRKAAFCLGAGLLAVQPLLADVTEPPDFSNTSPGTAYVLAPGTNTFSGTLTTPGDGRDYFRVTVPSGMRLNQVTRNFPGGGVLQNPITTFNDTEQITGTGTGTFTGAGATPFPLPAGTYNAWVGADVASANPWNMKFVVGPTPDYTIITASGFMTVSDVSGNSDTLVITQAVAGTIRFAAAGRSFGVNAAALTTNDSGNISLSGIIGITVNNGNGNNTDNVYGFAGTSFPSLTIYGGPTNDAVNLNGAITFAADQYLDVELQDGTTNDNNINVAGNANLITSGFGSITLECTKYINLFGGSSLQVQNGDLTVEANQQTSPAPGNFMGVNINGGTLKSIGAGFVTVNGRGGNTGGYQLGVQVNAGGKIIGNSNGVSVTGIGGATTDVVTRGVTVDGVGALITCTNFGTTFVTGRGGPIGGYYGLGISVLNGGEISGGDLEITAIGAGTNTSGFNQGLEIAGGGSRIITTGGSVYISAAAGPGDSYGVYLANNALICTPAAAGSVLIASDTVSIDGTSSVNTTNPASDVQFATRRVDASIYLGFPDVNAIPATLGLTDAELDRVNTANLIIGDGLSKRIVVLAPITHPTATNFYLFPGPQGLLALVSGTDISNPGIVSLSGGPLACPITGPIPDTDYPQLKVSGSVDLTGASLLLTNSTYAGPLGSVFTLISNQGTNPVIGTFDNLPENAFLLLNGQPVQIHYTGGDGNDVTLVRANPPLLTGSRRLINGTKGDWFFSGAGFSNTIYGIQASTNLVSWKNIGFATGDVNGSFSYTDKNASGFPYQFYRTTN